MAAAAAAEPGTSAGDVKRAFDFSVSDFATIVTTTAYVDKSMMIRDVYNASSRVLITAPPRFGKSTNLDMVKRFFEVEVDARGIAKPVQTTNNYKLFMDYNLEICKDIGFLKEHFGKHPVVHIGFKPLRSVNTSAEILNAFKMIVKNSLNQHNYILQYPLKEQVFSGITGFDENEFRKRLSDGITEDVDEVNLANSFKHLSTILKRIIGRKVYVLIDSYDAFLDSPVIENSTDREKMMSFVESSIGQLLNNIDCVDRVLITGVIPGIFEGFLYSENNIECYHFLDSHPFTKYYGLTDAEVDTVLSKLIECDEERRDVINTINDYYNAYETRNRDIRVYNVWSVLQYVRRRRVQSYWCELRYVNKFREFFKLKTIRYMLQQLFVGYAGKVDISRPLPVTDFLKVNSSKIIERNLFLVLLYHFGYLSVDEELARRGLVRVNIPSKEIKYELAKAVFYENRELYRSPRMDGILSALDAFQPDATKLDQHCETFRKNMSNFHRLGRFGFTEILPVLYVNLVTNAEYSRVIARTFGDVKPTTVSLKNRNQVVVCLTYHIGKSAEIAHQKVTSDVIKEHIFDVSNAVRGKVIIAFGLVGKQIAIAYSYYFKTGDNLREVRKLP